MSAEVYDGSTPAPSVHTSSVWPRLTPAELALNDARLALAGLAELLREPPKYGRNARDEYIGGPRTPDSEYQ